MNEVKTLNDKKIVALEKCLQLGQLHEVRDFVKQLRAVDIPRRYAAKIANLERRIGDPNSAIRLLHRYVRPKVAFASKASPEENAEYAIALSHVGAINEGYQLLEEISEQKFENVILYKAFSLFHRWDYEAAVPHLLRYLSIPKLSEYQRGVAQVNLAAAYCNLLQDSLAGQQIKEVEDLASRRGYKLLLSNILEISIELCIRKGDFELATKNVEKSLKLLGDSHERYVLYAKKWRAVINLFSTKKAKGTNEVLKVKDEAAQKHYWEVSRECDFYLALAKKDEGLFKFVFFGSPYWPYRKKINSLFDDQLAIGASLDVLLEATGFSNLNSKTESRVFDVERGADLFNGVALKEGHLHHRLLQILSSDFYRPLTTEALFGFLFPKQYFNPETSNGRVYSAISGLRVWLRQNEIPLNVLEREGYYSLGSEAALVLRVGTFPKAKLPVDYFIKALAAAFGDKGFNVQQAALVADKSKSKAKRLLALGVEQKQIQQLGKGPKTIYQIKKTK